MNTKRNVFLWLLYDFANSVISIVFFLYFAQWIIVEQGIADIYFNLVFTGSALLLLLTVPITGFLLDKFFRRITGLRYSTASTIVLYIAVTASAILGNSTLALILYTIGLYFYLLTFTFYTPLINDISTPERRGRISGYGVTANYLGQFTGLLFVLPFSNGLINLFNSSPRVETLTPAIVLFTILALPMLIWFKEPKKEKKELKISVEVKELFVKTKEIFLYPGIALFILAYFFFNDAILTASTNFPLFLEGVWGVSDNVKTFILLGILITSAIGGTVSGIIADKVGHKKTLLVVTTGWIFLLPTLALATNFKVFVVMTTLMGFWFGANWAVSRSVMAYLSPPKGYNLAFAYFGLVERASSFVGPVVWGLVVGSLAHLGGDKYRYSTIAVTGFIVLGLIMLVRVRSDRAPQKIQQN